MRALAALVWPLAFAACAPSVSLRVPGPAVAELPLERKLVLLDGENGLLAAVDARDAQEDRAFAAGEARRDASRRLKEADNAREGSPDVLRAAVAEAEARREFADRDRDLQRALVDVANAELLVADARFEEQRAKEVESAALAGAQGIHLDEFAAQVAKMERARDSRAADAKSAQADADKARAAWEAARGELAKLTGGAQGSVWVN
jgi:hypothetical protein